MAIKWVLLAMMFAGCGGGAMRQIGKESEQDQKSKNPNPLSRSVVVTTNYGEMLKWEREIQTDETLGRVGASNIEMRVPEPITLIRDIDAIELEFVWKENSEILKESSASFYSHTQKISALSSSIEITQLGPSNGQIVTVSVLGLKTVLGSSESGTLMISFRTQDLRRVELLVSLKTALSEVKLEIEERPFLSGSNVRPLAFDHGVIPYTQFARIWAHNTYSFPVEIAVRKSTGGTISFLKSTIRNDIQNDGCTFKLFEDVNDPLKKPTIYNSQKEKMILLPERLDFERFYFDPEDEFYVTIPALGKIALGVFLQGEEMRNDMNSGGIPAYKTISQLSIPLGGCSHTCDSPLWSREDYAKIWGCEGAKMGSEERCKWSIRSCYECSESMRIGGNCNSCKVFDDEQTDSNKRYCLKWKTQAREYKNVENYWVRKEVNFDLDQSQVYLKVRTADESYGRNPMSERLTFPSGPKILFDRFR